MYICTLFTSGRARMGSAGHRPRPGIVRSRKEKFKVFSKIMFPIEHHHPSAVNGPKGLRTVSKLS
jgi:hypothetical protein